MDPTCKEKVLVFPTLRLHELGYFQGIKTDIYNYAGLFLPCIQQFIDRDVAEKSPEWKQLIPYIVLRAGDKILCYKRGKSGRESRLHEQYSIGIGGHINPIDTANLNDMNAYQAGMLRELEEETGLTNVKYTAPVALINDDNTEVGKVHFGVLHIVDVDPAQVKPREDALRDMQFIDIRDALGTGFNSSCESWSQLAISYVWQQDCLKRMNQALWLDQVLPFRVIQPNANPMG